MSPIYRNRCVAHQENYEDLSSPGSKKLLMLARKEGFLDDEHTKECTPRRTEVLDEALMEVCD